jgi:hypothetical protein
VGIRCKLAKESVIFVHILLHMHKFGQTLTFNVLHFSISTSEYIHNMKTVVSVRLPILRLHLQKCFTVIYEICYCRGKRVLLKFIQAYHFFKHGLL